MLGGATVEGTTNHDGTGSASAEAVEAELESKKEIVQHHKRTGMSDEQIKNTPSFKRLLELDPTFKL
jgi:hypothetical protein